MVVQQNSSRSRMTQTQGAGKARAAVRPRTATPAAVQQDAPAVVDSILESYASRGVFAGFRRDKRQGGKADFTVQWHFRQIIPVRLDAVKSTLTMPGLIPQVSAVPGMRRELAAYLRRCAAPERPPHRRIDPAKAQVECYVRNNSLSLRVSVKDGDYEYATRSLVHLVNEIFLDFLRDAQYVEYMVAHMNMNPETGGSL